jgi:membrane protein implicated in regulation of membrane protease activity
MDRIFAWQNVIFYIPIAVGIILVFGSAFGGHDGDADGDHDADADNDGDIRGAGHIDDPSEHHVDSAENGLLHKALSLLGVGRVPLTVVMMMSSLLFGGIGIVMNTILSAVIGVPWIYGPISIVVAFLGMATLTGKAAKLLNRFMPTTETYRVSKHDLAGQTGVLLLPSDTSDGLAQVKDHEGNIHNVQCRTLKGPMPKGGEILVIEYDEETNKYVVDANPVSAKTLTNS